MFQAKETTSSPFNVSELQERNLAVPAMSYRKALNFLFPVVFAAYVKGFRRAKDFDDERIQQDLQELKKLLYV